MKKVIDNTFTVITTTAASGEEIALAGFGRFKVTDLPERQGRNPATGEPITIAASKEAELLAGKDRPRGTERHNERNRGGCLSG